MNTININLSNSSNKEFESNLNNNSKEFKNTLQSISNNTFKYLPTYEECEHNLLVLGHENQVNSFYELSDIAYQDEYCFSNNF